MKSVATFGILAVLGLASSASALIITGQGAALPGGGSCSIAGITTTGTGATVTCTGISLASHTKVYYGIRANNGVNGNNMTAATPSGANAFRSSSTGASVITYTSTTPVVSFLPTYGTDTVTNTLSLTRTVGTASVVATGGTPANSGANGDIGHLYQITSGSTLTLDVDILASVADPAMSGQACPGVYDPRHSTSGAGGDISKVELTFYWSDCGDGVIDSPEVCDDGVNNGTADSCCTTSCTFQSGGTQCTDSSPTDCKDAQCNGTNVCDQNFGDETAGTSCAGNGTNECSVADTCNASGTCLDNDVSAGTPCTDTSPPGSNDLNQCKDAQCTGTGACNQTQGDETDGTACAEGDFCTSGDVCSAGICASGSGDPCPGPDGDGDCTETCVDIGFETGNCTGNDPNGSPCTDGMFCNGPDTCDTGACTNHTGDPCVGPDGDTDCSESCDEGADNCLAADPDGTLCRSAAGACDVVETCSSGACPADAVQPLSTLCNAGSGDSCDPDEVCDGASTSCPADGVTLSGTVCRPGSGDPCDPDETCTGTADQPCPPDDFELIGTVCNPGSGDICDPDEVCPGVAAGTCAAEVVLPASTVCNPGTGDVCDPDETCPGTPDQPCPTDNFASSSTVCRAPGGVCDAAENCTGSADQPCPGDLKEPNGTPCRAAAGVCDVAEDCDGSSNACPADLFQPDGQSCSDGLFCNGDETCQSGSCAAGTDPCTFVCSEGTDMCLTDACPAGLQANCRTSTKKLLLVKNKMDNSKDKLIWKFIKGEATSPAEFANPQATAAYALCIYAGTADTLVATLSIPPHATRWQPIGTKGFKYKDASGSQSGVQKIIVKSGAAGKTKALLKGKGANLPDPLDSAALGTNVTAQLLNHESGICWETTLTAPKKDTQELYKAKQ